MSGMLGSRWSPRQRRWVQAVAYETGAVMLVAPVFTWVFDHPPGSALALTVVLSAVALLWNVVFNGLFERWEARQAVRERTLLRRLAHGAGFEGGLVLLLVPIMAVWLRVSWWEALLADLGLLAFFFFYTVAFTWAFDKLVGLPASAQPTAGPAR